MAGAELLFRQNVATSQRVLGADHPNVGAAKASLAQLLSAKGDAAGAEALLQESLAIDRQVFGEAHPEYAMALNNLANALEVQGRLQRRKGAAGSGGQHRASEAWRPASTRRADMLNLARLQIELGNAAATEHALRQVLSVRQRLLQSGDWRIAQVKSLLGRVPAGAGTLRGGGAVDG